MSEGINQVYKLLQWNNAYMKGVLTCTHTLKLLYEAMLSKKGSLWVDTLRDLG